MLSETPVFTTFRTSCIEEKKVYMAEGAHSGGPPLWGATSDSVWARVLQRRPVPDSTCAFVVGTVDPLAPQPEPGVLLEEYQALLLAEKDCVQVGSSND
eukprot:scaffold127300_cov17-Tisochrysis_lutea.AAC.1